MNTKEAKDFLVQEAVVQASLENVLLSDLEKRMMYFVENDPESCSDPLELNDEFEENYDAAEYEAKMAQLFQGAYARVRTENPDKARRWDDAVRLLETGDHYLPVLCRTSATTGGFLSELRIIVLLTLAILAVIVVAGWLAR
jgi:hypothetical protein